MKTIHVKQKVSVKRLYNQLVTFFYQQKNRHCRNQQYRSLLLVPMAGLEPARLASPPPQDGVSTNSTTSAILFNPIVIQINLILISCFTNSDYSSGTAGISFPAAFSAGTSGVAGTSLAGTAISCVTGTISVPIKLGCSVPCIAK